METDGLVEAVEITLSGQPVSFAPQMTPSTGGDEIAGIRVADSAVGFVEAQLRDAFTYLRCIFHVSFRLEKVSTSFEAENDEERGQITIPAWSSSSDPQPPTLPYDLVTRSLFAAEKARGPGFEATFIESAREAAFQQRYIDAFRYSFLLIEAAYGNGKFKSRDLKAALTSSETLREIVAREARERLRLRFRRSSKTMELLDTQPGPDAVIHHMVDMRGLYFHTHRSGASRWDPSEQQDAEALAVLSLNVAQNIAFAATSVMFEDGRSNRHYQEAAAAGAIVSLKVQYEYWERGHTFAQRREVNVRTPGTRMSSDLAMYTLMQSLENFQKNQPASLLKSITGVLDDGTEVFRVVLNAGDAPETVVDAPFQKSANNPPA